MIRVVAGKELVMAGAAEIGAASAQEETRTTGWWCFVRCVVFACHVLCLSAARCERRLEIKGRNCDQLDTIMMNLMNTFI